MRDKDYSENQAEWLKNVGDLKRGDHLLVLESETAWKGRVVQFHEATPTGIKCHSFGMYQIIPFFQLSKC